MSCCLSFASQKTDELSVSAVGHSIFSILRTDKVLSADKAQGSEFSKKVAPYRPEITVNTIIVLSQQLTFGGETNKLWKFFKRGIIAAMTLLIP